MDSFRGIKSGSVSRDMFGTRFSGHVFDPFIGTRSGPASQNSIQNYLNCIVPKIVQGACPHCGKVGVVGQRGNGRAATEFLGTCSRLASRDNNQNSLNCFVPKIIQGACPHCGKVSVVGGMVAQSQSFLAHVGHPLRGTTFKTL